MTHIFDTLKRQYNKTDIIYLSKPNNNLITLIIVTMKYIL